MKKWTDSPPCRKRTQCHACRCDEKFRVQLARHFATPSGWPDCPHGITLDELPEPKRGEPEWYEPRMRLCKTCPASCWPTNVSRCQRRAALRTTNFACPIGRFSPELGAGQQDNRRGPVTMASNPAPSTTQ